MKTEEEMENRFETLLVAIGGERRSTFLTMQAGVELALSMGLTPAAIRVGVEEAIHTYKKETAQ